ncbi:MAG TPA: RsmD family RNA methyltransferase [Gemmatimonadaceae bacterium]|nr:RsmD family RNA methyltransferase [Gemmatimonadaceae bacterium]
MRIIAGKLKGRDLRSPSDFRVRPTAEHVRGAMLDLLANDIQDARVLDLFAGTGALGIEALSRGARSADFIETRPASLGALKANIMHLRLRGRARIFKRDALPFAGMLTENSYDLAFADPPYESRMLDRVLDHWRASRFAPVLAVEHAATHVLPGPPPAVRQVLGDTAISIFRAG